MNVSISTKEMVDTAGNMSQRKTLGEQLVSFGLQISPIVPNIVADKDFLKGDVIYEV